MSVNKGYDYVIVGGGSAGCVLANRLSEDGGARVLLIEAGGRDLNPLIHIPLGMGKMHEYDMFNWGYHTEPEPNLNGRKIEAMRGKVLGGSSSINVMAYTRGHRGDYDRWRGGAGPVGTQFAKTADPLYDAWIQAALAAGLPVTDDSNGKQQEGFGRGQYTIRDGYRSSAASAYLKPARARANLHVATRAHATRGLMQGTRATGVEYSRSGRVVRVEAEREVILSGGAFNTPTLLMLSGIGPGAHLREIGIEPLVDLPVGKNLQDHLAVILFFRRLDESAFLKQMRFDRMAVAMLRAYFFGTGPGTVVPGGLHAFIKTRPELAVPDIEFMFRGAPAATHLWFPLIRAAYVDGYGIRPTILHPDSRGEILLRSADPRAAPRIVYNFFSAPDDLPRLREGVKRARDVAYQKPMAPYRGPETSPGEGVETVTEIDAWLRNTAITAHHPCGTCAMGTGPDTVTDPQLRVHGVEHLRVVDACVMPDLVSAHIDACVLMIAEKAADLIRNKPPLPADYDA